MAAVNHGHEEHDFQIPGGVAQIFWNRGLSLSIRRYPVYSKMCPAMPYKRPGAAQKHALVATEMTCAWALGPAHHGTF